MICYEIGRFSNLQINVVDIKTIIKWLKVGEAPLRSEKDWKLFFADHWKEYIYEYTYEKWEMRIIAKWLHCWWLWLTHDNKIIITWNKWIYELKNWKKKKLISEYKWEKLICNDCIIDPIWRLIFWTMHISNKVEKYWKIFSYYKWDLKVLQEWISLSNWFVFSSDNKTLYHVDSAERKIFTYKYILKTWNIVNKKTFINLSQEDWIPDWITKDKKWNLYIAMRYWWCILIINKKWNIIDRIKFKNDLQISSCCFWWKKMKKLFITAAAKPYESDFKPLHIHLEKNKMLWWLYEIDYNI